MDNHLWSLRALMQERNITACLVTSPANRRYISGFSGSSGALLITADIAILFTDSRYRVQAKYEAPLFDVHEFSAVSPLPQVFAAFAARLDLRQIGFESSHVSVALYNDLTKALAAQFISPTTPPDLLPTQNLVETLRETKDANELVILRQAIAITDTAFEVVAAQLKPDMTEKQVAWMLEVALHTQGADGVAFPIIVAAGPNAALPHAQPSNQPLGTERPIVIDMGALLQGYHADLTRTIILGEPDQYFWEIYMTVISAQQHTITNLRAGLTCAQADALARDIIGKANFGDNFSHGLGHGVGLEIHEGPRLHRIAPDIEDQSPHLYDGNVISIEPGIYIEGWGGVRIEDLALIHTDGCELLSQAPKLIKR